MNEKDNLRFWEVEAIKWNGAEEPDHPASRGGLGDITKQDDESLVLEPRQVVNEVVEGIPVIPRPVRKLEHVLASLNDGRSGPADVVAMHRAKARSVRG